MSVAYTLHDRSEWLQYSRHGMSGPSQDRTAVRWIVIHYNGGNADLDGPDNIFQDEDYAKVLARMNDQYWESPARGYALGYNFGCGPDGDLWEIRGTDIRCAANGCQLNNVPGVAIQVTTTAVTAPPTDAQIDALKNRWVPWLRTQYPKVLTIVGHRDVRGMCGDGGATACPGPELYPLVQQGYFNSPDEGDWFDMATEAELRAIVKQEVALGVAHMMENLPPEVWAQLLPHTTAGAAPAPASSFLRSGFRASNDLWEGDAPSDTKRNEQHAAELDAIAKVPGGGSNPVPLTITLEGTATPTP